MDCSYGVSREHNVAIDDAWSEWTADTGIPWYVFVKALPLPIPLPERLSSRAMFLQELSLQELSSIGPQYLFLADPWNAEWAIEHVRSELEIFGYGTGPADAMEAADTWVRQCTRPRLPFLD